MKETGAGSAGVVRPWWLLKRVEFLSALDSDELATVAASLSIHRFKKSEVVFDSLEQVRHVHILLDGAVKVSRVNPDSGKELILYIVAPGEPFGVIPFFDEKDSDLIATALRASRVGTIERHSLESLLQDKGVEDAFLHLVASRGRRLEERLYELAFHNVSRRLALLLVQLSEQFPNDRECGREIGVWLSQQDLASFIAATREMASLTINEFKRKGWVVSHGRRLCIHDLDALQEFIAAEEHGS